MTDSLLFNFGKTKFFNVTTKNVFSHSPMICRSPLKSFAQWWASRRAKCRMGEVPSKTFCTITVIYRFLYYNTKLCFYV